MAQKEQSKESADFKSIQKSKRIGIAEGMFQVPDDFVVWDEEIVEMFEDNNVEISRNRMNKNR